VSPNFCLCFAGLYLLPLSFTYEPSAFHLVLLFVLCVSFKGKDEAEKSVVQEFGEKSLIIKPAIVAGGTPGEIRPPGPPGVKPVDVEALSKVVVAGALGSLSGKIDGNESVAAAAS